MKERGKGFIAGMLVSAVLAGTIGTAAATIGSRTVKADYADIKITLNDSQITPKDATGATVEPFSVNGTTYLPVRAVANALGVDVDWNGDTSTVILSTEKSNENIDYIMKLGFYKKLSEGFEELESLLNGILNGSAAATINTVLKEGPYAGMTFASATQAKLSNTAALIDSHYDACFAILNTDDIILASDYTILNGKTASFFESLSTGSQTFTKNDVQQAYFDAMMYKMSADTMFWETYQSAFG